MSWRRTSTSDSSTKGSSGTITSKAEATRRSEATRWLQSNLMLSYFVVCLVPQHEAALREIVELRRKLNEFQANSLTQNHLHSVSALEMKAKVSDVLELSISELC